MGSWEEQRPHRALPGLWRAMAGALPPAQCFETQLREQTDITETWDTQKTAWNVKEPQPGVLDHGANTELRSSWATGGLLCRFILV